MEKYTKLKAAFKEVGGKAVDYGLLALSELAHVVPGEGMDIIEERTGVDATKQCARSMFFEFVEGIGLAAYGVATANPLASYVGLAMEFDSVTRFMLTGIQGNGALCASLAVEIPYGIGKKIYSKVTGKPVKASRGGGSIDGDVCGFVDTSYP